MQNFCSEESEGAMELREVTEGRDGIHGALEIGRGLMSLQVTLQVKGCYCVCLPTLKVVLGMAVADQEAEEETQRVLYL